MRKGRSLVMPSITYWYCIRFQNPCLDIHAFPCRSGCHEKLMTYLHGLSNVDTIYILEGALFLDFDMACDFHTEIVQDHACPDFLLDLFPFAGMEVLAANGMLQMQEGGFNAPTKPVKAFEFHREES